jgi:hypothetical protein
MTYKEFREARGITDPEKAQSDAVETKDKFLSENVNPDKAGTTEVKDSQGPIKEGNVVDVPTGETGTTDGDTAGNGESPNGQTNPEPAQAEAKKTKKRGMSG